MKLNKEINQMDIDEFLTYMKKQVEEFNKNNLDDFSNIKNMTLNDILSLTGKIYFIQAGNNGAIKIGYADNVEKRLKQIQTGNPYKLKLLKTINGNFEIEKNLHKLFYKDRLEGEWFTPSKELMDYININEINNIDNKNHIINFVQNHIKFVKDVYVESIKLYEFYQKYCIKNKIIDYCNNVNFGKSLKLLLPKGVVKKQKKLNNTPVWIYSNMELNI